nr:N-terminal phage integrase SAM-like domain-containing protein [Marasmitruncus massiliensis]
METWVENHGKANLRPSTFASYKGYIRNYIIPNLGMCSCGNLLPLCWTICFRRCLKKGCHRAWYGIPSVF